jgi:hypothetical protein
MPKKSVQNNNVRKRAKDLSPPSSADLDRLRNAMKGTIDTSEISESRSFNRLKRDANGSLPRRSLIRDAIESQRKQHNLTVYALWKKAREIHPSLSQAAVGEFLKGKRELELPSAEALIIAVNLTIVRKESCKRSATRKASKSSVKKLAR